MTAEKSSKKGLAILFVGVMLGLGIGIAVCVIGKTQTVASSTKNAAHAGQSNVSKIETATVPPPKLYPPPAQLSAAANQQLNSAPNEQLSGAPNEQLQTFYYQTNSQLASAPPQQILQSPDGSLAMPGVNNAATGTPESTANSINPNWRIGRNGMIQNPCVDPPSAHGRQTGLY